MREIILQKGGRNERKIDKKSELDNAGRKKK